MFLLTFIGILAALGGIAMMIIYPSLRKTETTKSVPSRLSGGTPRTETLAASHPILLWCDRKRSALLLLVGIFLISINGMFFYAEPGVNYMVQYPWGGQKAVTTAGFSTKFWGRTIPFQNEIVFKYVLPNADGTVPENSSHAKVQKAQQWEFNDAIKGHIATSVIIGVNVLDDETFIQMALKNKSENNLVFSRIVPSINASLKNSAKLMSAQEYLVGRSSDFDYYFRDQLEHGLYRLEEELIEDEQAVIGDTSATRTVGGNNQQPMKRVYKIMVNASNEPIRQLGNDGETVFKQYNLSIVDAIAEKVDWETKFDERLDTQKALVAEVQAQKQGAEKEFFRAKKEEQTGEANKIKKEKELEVLQLEETVAAETRMKSAKFKREEQENLFEANKIQAKSIKVIADAEAYKNLKLVSAGLTPQERAYWNYRSDSVNAAYISKMATPSIMTTGGDGGGNGEVGTLLQMQILDQLKKK